MVRLLSLCNHDAFSFGATLLTLLNLLQVCMDIDECADDTYYCPQPNTVCVNTVGSYTCACRLGFVQKVDGLATFCEEITKPLHYRNYEV